MKLNWKIFGHEIRVKRLLKRSYEAADNLRTKSNTPLCSKFKVDGDI